MKGFGSGAPFLDGLLGGMVEKVMARGLEYPNLSNLSIGQHVEFEHHRAL